MPPGAPRESFLRRLVSCHVRAPAGLYVAHARERGDLGRKRSSMALGKMDGKMRRAEAPNPAPVSVASPGYLLYLWVLCEPLAFL